MFQGIYPGFQDPDSGFQDPDSGFQDPDSGSGSGLRILGSGFWISGSGSRISRSESQIQGLKSSGSRIRIRSTALMYPGHIVCIQYTLPVSRTSCLLPGLTACVRTASLTLVLIIKFRSLQIFVNI